MKIVTVLIPSVLLVASSACISAAPISIFNTGQGSPLTVDPNFTIVATPGGPVSQSAYITDLSGFPSPYWMANGVSSWISPQASYWPCCGISDAPGLYTYRTSFSLAGLNALTASISLQLAADDSVTDVLINGASTGFTHFGFGTLSNVFTINSGYLAGLNTLDFVTSNGSGLTGNPASLRVEFTSATADVASAVPEPGSFALLGGGLFLSAMFARRRISE